jgi:YYY domain-containing protein
MDFSLIPDWLSREGGSILSWWLLVTLAGAAVWPLLFRLLGGLPDRGYTLARTAGLMLTGFVFWFLGSLGVLDNEPGGMVFAWIVVLAVSLVAFLRWPDRPSVREWFGEHWLLVLLTEVLFLALLFGWALYRAHEPEIGSTEKPMEFMFLNSVRASQTFPPHDAWLSGYAISYYYFGYVLMAMLADLSSVSSGVAFGIMVAMIFALAGIGTFGVVYNLVRSRIGRFGGGSVPAALAAGVLGMCFLVLMGNLGTALIELPYRGYTSGLVNADYFDFWDVAEHEGTATITDETGATKKVPVDSDGDGTPNWDEDAQPLDRWGNWWWFRESRLINDRHLDGQIEAVNPISEFPNFSFVLSDLHPHVLALPFAVLAIGLALGLVLGGRDPGRWDTLLYAIWVGGLIFMNSWDAVYIVVLIGADVLRRVIRNGSGRLNRSDVWGILRFTVGVGGLALICYLPWIISFTSQASGVLPNVIYPTPWQQFFLQFGIFLVPLAIFLVVEVSRAGWRFNWQAGLLAAVVTLWAGVLILAVQGWMAWGNQQLRYPVYSVPYVESAQLRDLLSDILNRRLVGLPSELFLLGMVFFVAGRLFARPAVTVHIDAQGQAGEAVPVRRTINYSPAAGFALLLVGAGAILIFAPDFVYLHDNFALRINTVFKLYYQGWVLFSIAGAYAIWSVLSGETVPTAEGLPVARQAAPLQADDGETDLKPKRDKTKRGQVTPTLAPLAGRLAFGIVVVALFAAGMVYPAFAAQSRALYEYSNRQNTKDQIDACQANDLTDCGTMPPLTLNGAPTMVSSDEYAAIQCLADLDPDRSGVLLEAPCNCGYHPEIGRFSAQTGIPTLMGWGNHEGQWRGSTLPELIDTRIEDGVRRDRFTDAREVYTTQDWARAWQIIDRYGIDYIVVGNAERTMIQELANNDATALLQYQQGLDKFSQVLSPVCQAGGTVVYRVAPQ